MRLGLLLVISFFVGFLVLIWWCANEICHPSKRPVRAKAAAYFDGSAGAGFSIDRFVSEGGMPCLVCTPVPVEKFSERAAILRDQVSERGFVLKPPGEFVGTILILHGRRGRKENYLPVAERFCAVGFRCVIPDLPGHGENPEKYATYGVNEGEMVLKCYQECAKEFGFKEQPCGVFGQSMGGSVAVHTAAMEGAPFQSMVILASFDKLENVIRHQTNGMMGPIFGPAIRVPADYAVGWMSGVKISDIRPAAFGPRITIPTLFAHGDADNKVPASAGRGLYESFPEDSGKRWLSVPGADHNDVMITDFPLYAEIAEWFLKDLTQP